jgi:serine/threonine-protein kinase
MGRIFLGRLVGVAGFSRLVAIKRLHAPFAKDPELVSMLLDEARLAACVRHPNVVQTIDVVEEAGELLLVLEYVHGDSLSRVTRVARAKGEAVPTAITAAICSGLLHGLHAAHEATDARGLALGLVHRDVSPQNVLLGVDGLVRVADFGVAKAAGRMRVTREGEIKGKLAYMAPEQLRGEASPRSDVFSAGVILWELLANQRLFEEASSDRVVPSPREVRPDAPAALSDIALRALRSDPAERFASAREMALAIEQAVPSALPSAVGAWLESLVADELRRRAELSAEADAASAVTDVRASLRAPERPAPTGRRGRRAVLALGVLTGATVSVSALFSVLGPRGRAPDQVATTAPEPPSVIAASSSPPPAVEPAAVRAEPPIHTSAPRPARRGAVGHAPTNRAADCDPPYNLSPSGQRQYKPACL